jgi:hypothetical protein
MNHFPVRDINKLQYKIMVFVKGWCNTEKTPVPQKEIIKDMVCHGVKSFTALNAINALLTKGYIRRGYSEKANRTLYVMIRNI